MNRQPSTVRVIAVRMADGTPINAPQARQRIARAFAAVAVTKAAPVEVPAPRRAA